MSAKESRGPVQKAEPSRIRYPVKTAVTLPRTVVRAWHSPVAQLVERLTVNQEVAGSSPARGANHYKHFHPFHHTCPPLDPLSGSIDSPARDSFALGLRSSALTHRLPWLGIQRA